MKNNDLIRNYLNGGVKPISDLFRIDENGILKPTKQVVVYDLETTGVKPNKSNITQFAYSVFDVNWKHLKNKSVDEWIKLEDVRFEDIPKFLVKKTHIKKEDLENGKDLKEVLRKFLLVAKDSIIISFNGFNFDDKFITLQTIKKFAKDKDFWTQINNNPKDFKFNSDFDVYPFQYFMMKNKPIVNNKLETIASYFGLNPDAGQTHNAEYDSALTINVLRKLLSLGLSADVVDYPNIYLGADLFSVDSRGIREGNKVIIDKNRFFLNFTPAKEPHYLTYPQLESLARVVDEKGYRPEVEEYRRQKNEGIDKPNVKNQLPYSWNDIRLEYGCGREEYISKLTVISEIPSYYETLHDINNSLEFLWKNSKESTFQETCLGLLSQVYSPKSVKPSLDQFIELVKYAYSKKEKHVILKYLFNQGVVMIELLKMQEYLKYEKDILLTKKKKIEKTPEVSIF